MTLHPATRTRAAEVEAQHGVGFSDLKSPRKFYRFVRARQHYWWLLTKRDGFSLQRAGRVTGHHHTTVLYGIRQYEARFGLQAQERAA